MKPPPVVELLEYYLAHAKQGLFTGVAISVTGDKGTFQHHYTGGVSDEPYQLKSVQALANTLQDSIDNWQPYAQDYSLGADFAGFHCGLAPNGFDFLTWLLVQEMARRMADAPAPLKVAFWQGHKPPDIENSWITNVYRPMLKLIGAVEDARALQRIGKEIYLTKTLVDMHRAGFAFPKLRSTRNDMPKDVITITLREADYTPQRNSNIEAWGKFADWLRNRGERVVIVRDTAKADARFGDHEICPAASRDIEDRVALYNGAKLNCFVSNGPMMLSVFSDRPYLIFVPLAERRDYIPSHPLFWSMNMGVNPGEQFPWARPGQRIVWDKDTLFNIKQAYKEMTNGNAADTDRLGERHVDQNSHLLRA